MKKKPGVKRKKTGVQIWQKQKIWRQQAFIPVANITETLKTNPFNLIDDKVHPSVCFFFCHYIFWILKYCSWEKDEERRDRENWFSGGAHSRTVGDGKR